MATRLRSILLELDQGPVSRAVKRALGVLKSFSYTLPDGTSIALDVDAVVGSADSGILSEDTADLLTAVGEAARDRQSGVLIAIDEQSVAFAGDALDEIVKITHGYPYFLQE
jgi:hypothetical protein